jgi:hypothetical protein
LQQGAKMLRDLAAHAPGSPPGGAGPSPGN